MRILVLGGLAESLINFRGKLIEAMVSLGHTVIGCADGVNESVSQGLNQIGAKYNPIDIKRAGLNPLIDLRTITQLSNLIRHYKPDLVLSYTAKPVIYGSLVAHHLGIKKIFSIITGLGYAFTGTSAKQLALRRLLILMYRSALSKNDAVFFQNPDDRELFIQLGIVRNVTTEVVNGSGVDTEHFYLAPLSAEPIFLLIARLLKDKGIYEYVESARILKKAYPHAVFKLLGPFDPNPASIKKSEIQSWQDEGIIEYLGQSTDVRPYIASCNIYVLPSYREGMPRTVLEAMSMGRPIITTNTVGCKETVIEGVNGFLVPCKDVPALVKAMKEFIENPALIPSMAMASRKIAEDRFDVAKVNMVLLQAMGLSKG